MRKTAKNYTIEKYSTQHFSAHCAPRAIPFIQLQFFSFTRPDTHAWSNALSLECVCSCHWGAMNSIGCKPNDDASACPTNNWCPFSELHHASARSVRAELAVSLTHWLRAADWYRTSGDINAGENSWFENLQSVIPYAKQEDPLSSPSCWAYPESVHSRIRA